MENPVPLNDPTVGEAIKDAVAERAQQEHDPKGVGGARVEAAVDKPGEVAALKKENPPAPAADKTHGTVLSETDKQAAAEMEKLRRRELKTTLEQHRKRYDRGMKIWRVVSLLVTHLFALATSGSIFVWKSSKLLEAGSPITQGTRTALIFGLILFAIVSIPLLLEYMRNWRNHRVAVGKVDRLILELTENKKVEEVSAALRKIIEDDLDFIRRSTD